MLTNGKTIQKADDIHTQNVLFQKHYWDISHGKVPGQTVDDTDIFTKDFGKTILLVLLQITVIEQTCLYKLTCVFFPEILVQVYFNFTSRLLERNVVFPFKSHVNKGILKTIEEEPDKSSCLQQRFDSYSNWH